MGQGVLWPDSHLSPPHTSQAHTATYRALKAMEGGSEAQIGLVHHHITFKARGNGCLHWPAR